MNVDTSELPPSQRRVVADHHEPITDAEMARATELIERMTTAFDAKLVLELGVLELTVGRLDAARLARLRTLMEATLPYIHSGRFTDPYAYESANSAFHSYLIELADNPLLSQLYDRLRIPEITARALSGDVRAEPELLAEHRALVDAYERGDLTAARDVVKAHSERSKQIQRAGIVSAGGSI